MTLVTVEEGSVSKMWSAYMKEAGEQDKLMTDTWKEHAMGIFMFVGIKLLIQCCYRDHNITRLVFSAQSLRPSSSRAPRCCPPMMATGACFIFYRSHSNLALS